MDDGKKILIIDDDVDLVEMVSSFLILKKFKVLKAYGAEEALEKVCQADLVILDINMPGKDGFDILNDIRKKWNMPVLFLTARNDEDDKVKGLMTGGDDYITKPFSLKELYARIYTNISRDCRRYENTGKFEVHEGVFIAEGKVIELTKSEFEITELLYKNPKQVFSKERIYDLLWGTESFGDPQVVSEHVRNIRNKFFDKYGGEVIKTHWGIGYSWIG